MNKYSNIFKLFFCLLISTIVSPAFAELYTFVFQEGSPVQGQPYYGTEDMWLNSREPNRNYGKSSGISVNNEYGKIKSFIRFKIDALPKDAEIVEAILSLYCTSIERIDTKPINVHYGIRPDWIEDSATWNTYDGINPWLTPGGEYNPVIISSWSPIQNNIKMVNTWANFNVTTKIQTNYNQLIGFVLVSSGGYGWTGFASSENENASIRPKLIITFRSNMPTANAGYDKEVGKYAKVDLDGTGSSDPNENQKSLIYSWHFISKPITSKLTDNDIVPNNNTGFNGADRPSFTADAIGYYEIMLTVTNSLGLSSSAKVTIYSFYIKNEHPRIWLTNEKLAKLRQKMQSQTTDWQKFKKYIDTKGGGIYDNALAYQLTKDPSYAQKAINILQQRLTYQTDPSNMEGAPPVGPYAVRYTVPEVAIAFDWLYDQLSESLKTQVVNKINEWSILFHPLKSSFDDSPYGNYGYGYLIAEGLAGLATYGDNPKAIEFIENNQYNRFEKMILPFLESYGKGGSLIDGGYSIYAYMFLFKYLKALKTATDEDFFRIGFPEESIYNTIYQTLPSRTHVHAWDNWGREASGLICNYHRSYMLILADEFAGTDSGRYAQWWLNNTQYEFFDYYLWEEFLWYCQDYPEGNINALEKAYFSPGTGMVMGLSDWTTDATAFSFRNGNRPAWCEHDDSNHFMIYKKGWLAVDANIYAGGMLDATYAHNTILIDDQNQLTTWSTENITTKYENNPKYVYIIGDATKAYSASILKNFTRQFIFLRPDLFIIFDRVSSIKANSSKKWLLHTRNEPQIFGDTITAVNGNGKLFSKTLFPQNFIITKINEKTLNGDLNTWRIVVQPNEPRIDDIFLHVLYATSANTIEMPSVLKIDGDNMIGTQILGNIVLFSKNESNVNSVQYSLNTNGLTSNILCDMEPLTTYSIFINGSFVKSATSNENGLLNFELPINGSTQITVSKYGTPPPILIGKPGKPNHIDG